MAKGTGGVCDLGYHVVWCPKCRRAVLVGLVRDRFDALIRQKCATHDWLVVAHQRRYVDAQDGRLWLGERAG
ncbi:transposase [Parafrankia sp. FMc2]